MIYVALLFAAALSPANAEFVDARAAQRAMGPWTLDATFEPTTSNDYGFGSHVAVSGDRGLFGSGTIDMDPEETTISLTERDAAGWSALTPLVTDVDPYWFDLVGDTAYFRSGGVLQTMTRGASGWGPLVPVGFNGGVLTPGEHFSVSADGERIAVRGRAEDASCVGGKVGVLIVRRSGDAWVDDGEVIVDRCSTQEPLVSLGEGIGGDVLVLLTAEEKVIVDDHVELLDSRAHVYRRSGDGVWGEETTVEPTRAGSTFHGIAVEPPHLALALSGDVETYAYSGGKWISTGSLGGESADMSFGDGLALDGALLAVGAPYENIGTTMDGHSGVVHVFAFDGEWREEGALLAAAANVGIGTQLALDGDNLFVATTFTFEPDPHEAFVFRRSGERPLGMCASDDVCSEGRSCIDGICQEPSDDDDDDEPEDGCDCRGGERPGPLGLLALGVLVGLRRRR